MPKLGAVVLPLSWWVGVELHPVVKPCIGCTERIIVERHWKHPSLGHPSLPWCWLFLFRKV